MMPRPCKSILKNTALVAAFSIAGWAETASARDHLYGALDNPDLLNCETQRWSSRPGEADNCYRALQSLEYPPLVRAEAFWALGDLQNANTAFQTAQNAEPENAEVRLRWGELFMQTFQYQEAYNLFAEALELDPENAYAHIGAAGALAQGDNGEEVNAHMMTVVENALAPAGARLRGLVMMSRSAMQQDRYEDAREILDEAQELAQENALPRMELNALEAALAFMTHQPHEQFVEVALAEAPGYGDAWAIPAYFADITRRYRECGEFYGKAIEVQPDHWEAHLELGVNQLRQNQVSIAREHVQIAYEGDPFNPKTVNMLRLLDTFIEDMQVLNFPDPPQGPFPTLELRLDKKETGILTNYARELAMDSINLYRERYRFEPKAPVIVEIYPNHEDFVVRSIGMPGVGILGVTFGYLFAMDSPIAHPRGESYHWGTTLWHEMAHVFTLEASNHLVPRWYSEGISVFEEWRTGPIPGRKIPNNVLQAMAQGKFLSIAELDDGFMRPTYENQVIVSYMQAGLVFEFIDIEYGFEKIVDMLYLFRDGISPVEAIEQVMEISVRDFDRHFKQFIDIEYGPMLSSMGVWQEDHRASYAALEEENWEEAVAAAERANFVYPDYVEVDSPYIAMARAYSRLGDEENEFLTLQTFWEKGGYAPRALLALADRYIERDMQDQAHEVLKDVIWADPYNQELHVKLGDLYLERNQPKEALEEFRVLLALDPVDKAAANLRMARAYQALNDMDGTMEYLMTALDIAPQYRDAQMMLLELSRTTE